MYDIHDVQEVLRVGTTQDTRHQRLYRQWDNLWSTLLVNPDIQDPPISQIYILQVYGRIVHHNHYNKPHLDQIGKYSVSQA